MKKELIKEIQSACLIAYVANKVPSDAEAVIKALKKGGISVFEIQADIPQAFKLIEKYSKDKDLLIGVGGVLDGEVAQRAINAGAKIIDSPGTIPDVIMVARYNDILVSQGVSTISEALEAYHLDADLLKVYPINLLGGAPFLKTLKSVLPNTVKMIAAGGVNEENTAEYLKAGAIAVTLASGMIEKSIIRKDDWGVLTERAQDVAVKLESLKLSKNRS